MPSRANVNTYRAALDEAVRLAQGDLARAFIAMRHLPPETIRDGMIEVFEAVAARYGDLAATASADFYELLRPTTGGTRFSAQLAGTVNYEQVQGTVKAAAGHLWGSSPEGMLSALESSMQRYVEGAARGTIRLNAARDVSKPRWARVPAGPKTCAWCLMLASRGWTYESESSAGGAGNSFHDNDRCMIIPSWERVPVLEGYDPDGMRKLYEQARAEVEADGMVISEQAIAQRLRDMFPDRFKDGAVVPSILREMDAGWPDDVKPVSGRTWRHILKRHSATGDAPSRFLEDETEYEIAKILRGVISAPDYTAPHPERPTTTLNFFKAINGQEYLVGTYMDGAGRLTVATCFPVTRDGGIL